MPRMSLSAIVLLWASTCLFQPDATGQSVYGEMSGTFTDSLGVPITGAEVTITSIEKGSKLKTYTSEFGTFHAPNLLSDTYNIEVEADGFKRFRETGIPVFADQTSRVNGTLPKGDMTDFVTRSPENVDILKTDRTDVSTLFTRRSVAGLPLRDLNLTRLGLLVPGSLPVVGLGLSINQNPQNGSGINVNGQFFSGTALQLDGTDNRDPLEGLIVINPNLESVSEMKVTTQNYSAEFGEATAGVVTIQTRSGTNSWHGSVFDFRRTGWGQAKDPFSPTSSAFHRNEFGGSIGGPIVKNRLFVFGDYQGARQAAGIDQLLSVPTQLVHQTCVGGPVGICDLHEYLGLDPTNPNIGQVYDPKSHLRYDNNQIPNDQINVYAVDLLELLPRPNVGSPSAVVSNFVANIPRIVGADQFDTRVDYNAAGKLKLLARYSYADFRDDGFPAFGRIAGGAGTNADGIAGIARTRNQGLSAGFAYNVNANLLTDFRFGFFRYHLNLDSPDFGTMPALRLGLNTDLFSSGMPDFEFRNPLPGQQFNASLGSDYLRFGYSPQVNSCNCPLRQHEQQFQWANNWIKTSGKHVFKWGTDIRYLQNFRLASDKRRAGHLTFNARGTNSKGADGGSGGLSLATFLFGSVSSFERFYANPTNPVALTAGERQQRWFVYGQDSWRVTPRLTINYGLRWEVYFPQTVTANGAGGFLIPNFTTPASSVFNVPGAPGVDGRGNVKNTLKNFGPRLGVAFLLVPQTVVRAGYGRSFDAGFAGSIFGISATQNPPVMIIQSAFNPNKPVFTLGKEAPPNFIFPSFAARFTIKDLNSAVHSSDVDNQTNQSNVYAIPARLRLPTVDSWNFTVQHELATTMYFEIGYVGNKGTHVFSDAGAGSPRTSYYDLNQANMNGFVGPCGHAPPCIPKVSRQPFKPWAGQVRYFGNNASNNYNSLQAKLNKSFLHGYEFMAHYTWAKGLDYDSSYFNVDPQLNRMGYGPSNFDRTHSFVFTNLWSLPVGKGKTFFGSIGKRADRIVGGWGINSATVWYSGFPFSPTYNGCGRDRDTGPCRPNVVGEVHITGNRKEWFTTTGGIPFDQAHGTQSSVDPQTGVGIPGNPAGPWQEPAPGTFGTAARNSLRGPSFFESDIALLKDITFTERVSLRFRADVFNVFNKVNLANPGVGGAACVDCVAGAAIQALADGALQRQFQFSLKLQF